MRMGLCADGEFIEKKGTLLEKENLRIKKISNFVSERILISRHGPIWIPDYQH